MYDVFHFSNTYLASVINLIAGSLKIARMLIIVETRFAISQPMRPKSGSIRWSSL